MTRRPVRGAVRKSTAASGVRSRVCPICGKPADAENFPFCSKRCADIDLNRWLKGAYAIPSETAPEDGGGGAEEDDLRS